MHFILWRTVTAAEQKEYVFTACVLSELPTHTFSFGLSLVILERNIIFEIGTVIQYWESSTLSSSSSGLLMLQYQNSTCWKGLSFKACAWRFTIQEFSQAEKPWTERNIFVFLSWGHEHAKIFTPFLPKVNKEKGIIYVVFYLSGTLQNTPKIILIILSELSQICYFI